MRVQLALAPAECCAGRSFGRPRLSANSKSCAASACGWIAHTRVDRAIERQDLRDSPDSSAFRTRPRTPLLAIHSASKSDFYSDFDDRRSVDRVSSFIRASGQPDDDRWRTHWQAHELRISPARMGIERSKRDGNREFELRHDHRTALSLTSRPRPAMQRPPTGLGTQSRPPSSMFGKSVR
jgi:hypothetical protein